MKKVIQKTTGKAINKKLSASVAAELKKGVVTYEKGDNAEAFKIFKSLAVKGIAEAQAYLAVMYGKGLGISKDDAKALEWYQKATSQGHEGAQNNLGVMYEYGDGVSQDAAKAFGCYQMASAQGHAGVQYNLGRMYANGKGVEKNFSLAADWYLKAAEQEFVEAQFELGKIFDSGVLGTPDYENAVVWYCKAAEAGHAGAQKNLGDLYANGKGVTQDYQLAADWYRKAADQGNVVAQYKLGEAHHKGQGVNQDIDIALFWFRKAAEQNNKPSWDQILSIYEQTDKIEQIYAKEFSWLYETSKGAFSHTIGKFLPKAAEQGNVEARFMLGKAHCEGEWWAKKDDALSIKWLRMAAGQGHEAAQDFLGKMIKQGRDVSDLSSPEISRSEFWKAVEAKLDLAKAFQEMGDLPGAREILEEVLREGDETQCETAQTLLRNC